MPLTAVLDASVLFPISLCDLLLRLAEADVYQPLWSERILDEVRHSVLRREYARHVGRRLDAMQRRFPEAMVPPAWDVERTLSLPDPDDRHVVAAAVVGGSGLIVTRNLRDFPPEQLPIGIRAEHPDWFLQNHLAHDQRTVIRCIEDQAADTGRHGKPPLSVSYILRGVELAGAPEFVAAVRARLADG